MSNAYTRQSVYTSTQLKRALLSHLFYQLHYTCVIDEHQFMDVFGVKRSGYAAEFEIKVSRGDLRRETKLFKAPQPIKYSKDWVKWEKHAHQLKRDIIETSPLYHVLDSVNLRPAYYIPNEFWFFIPKELQTVALEDTVGTPYGIMTWDGGYGFDIVKKPEKLHTEKVTDQVYRQVAHGLSVRNRLLHLPTL